MPCAIEGCAVVGPTILIPVRLCRRDAARVVEGRWRLTVTLTPVHPLGPPPPSEGGEAWSSAIRIERRGPADAPPPGGDTA